VTVNIHIHRGDIHLIDLQTRMPFKYGIATMTRCPHAFVRLHLEADGQAASGIAADHLPPKWFTKVPDKPLDVEIAEMLRVIEHAVFIAGGTVADTPFDAWRQLYAKQDAWGRSEKLPALLVQFGTSLVERAMIDAVCRCTRRSFAELLWTNQWGIRLDLLHPELAGRNLIEFLPDRPLRRIIARHTIGMADYLTDAEIPTAERLADSLPQSLEACIRAYGLRHIKVKASGQVERDRDRLRRIAAVMAANGPADFAFSLDGNEQFHSVAAFRAFWEQLTATPDLQSFFGHLLFVEQPLHRDAALDPAAGNMMDWPARPRLIIDESDGELDSLRRALDLGYAGTSHKNCKGVFKGIANACLLAYLHRQGRPVIMSGEDLANIGPVALLQDLAVCATLGIQSVERNGHHYFAGLSMFSPEVQQQVLAAHGDLYHASPHGWPTLTIRDGCLETGSIIAAPFGVGPVIDVGPFASLAAWRQGHPR
jgi:hypothetical protein